VKISLVIPVLNEAEALPLLFRALIPVIESRDCEYEVLFVNDGSTDESLDILARAASADSRIKVLSFSRNLGHQAAITAGIDFSTGDTWFKRKTAALFYLVMRRLVDQRIPPEVSDFRLLGRNAVIAPRQLREQHRYMRGMIAGLGLRERMLPFERHARAGGETKYALSKMLRFSWTAICSFSALPLRMTMWLGLSLVFLQCLFFGVTLVCVSLIGDYTARIYEESKRRPLCVVNREVTIAEAPEEAARAVFLSPRLAETPIHASRI